AVNNFGLMGNVPYDSESYFIDYTSQPEVHGDKYKISLIDTCSNESAKSPFHKTMNLTIAAFGSTMGLNWDDYIDESGSFVPAKYYIYRGSAPDNMSLLDSISGSFNSYNDLNVFSVYYYIIGVKKNPPCNVNGSAYSYSNQNDNSTFVGINTPTYGTITVSPNPFNESTIISIPNYQITNNNAEIKISDVTGKVVRTVKFTNNQTVIERGDLKVGIYFVELRGERIYRGKLIVE
ncbi:MAG: T9SS type A sorting domain-containing protein, partial [Bacteroidetes bacterium]|nr:T9SS type A sorting domain-containing protein [Bacteroidota bacterium]